MELSVIQQLMNDATAGVSELGMRNIDSFLQQGGKRLKKDSLKVGTTGKRLYALAIRFPFNPINPEDPKFNVRNRYESPLSPESTVLYLKSLMRQDEKLHAHYAKLGGFKDASEYDVSQDVLTEQDWTVFKGYRTLLHYSMRIVKSTLSGHGKYGRKFLSKCKYDADGAITEKDDAQLIHELEVSIANQRIQEIKKEYKEGSKMNKPEKDMNDEIKAVWKGVKMSAPYFAGSIRCLVFEENDDWELQNKNDILKEGLASYEYYSGGSKQTIEKLMGYLGKKLDCNFNYLEVDINYPKCPNVDKEQEPLESYQKRTEQVNCVERISTIEGFDAAYREFRDNQDIFREQTMLDSVFEYHAIDSASLIEYYKSDLEDRKEYIDEQAAQTYKDLIGRVSQSISEELLDKMLDGELKVQPLSLESMAEPSEEDAGMGIDVVPEEEVTIE